MQRDQYYNNNHEIIAARGTIVFISTNEILLSNAMTVCVNEFSVGNVLENLEVVGILLTNGADWFRLEN